MFKRIVVCILFLAEYINPYSYDVSRPIFSPPRIAMGSQINQNPKRMRPDIKLYYESMCPYCRVLDSSVFSQVVSFLGPYLDISTYPFGKASVTRNFDGSLDFICQHGPNECYGNKLHACALDLIGQRDQALLFNGCMMAPERPANGSNDASAEQCGRLMGIDPTAIIQCAKGPRGSELLNYYGEMTKLVNLRFVPHLEINGQHWEGDHANLLRDVCAAFISPPGVCRSIL